jgi:hypothetical protein
MKKLLIPLFLFSAISQAGLPAGVTSAVRTKVAKGPAMREK